MKIQCCLCKEIVELGPFVSSSEGIEISCRSCARSFFLDVSGTERAPDQSSPYSPPTTGSPAEAASSATPSDHCPKCHAVVDGRLAACKACGLLRERFDTFAADAAAEVDGELAELWAACEASWSSEPAHEAFIAKASARAAYAPAARRYREVLRTRPGDPVASSRLERLTKMAEVALLSARPAQVVDEGVSAYKGVIALLAVLLLAAVGFGIYAVMKDTSPQRPPSRSVPTSR